MMPLRAAWIAAVFVFAALLTLPAATAQPGARVALELSVLSDGAPVTPGVDVPIHVHVARMLPPLTTCMEPEPIEFSVIEGAPHLDKARFEQVKMTPPPTPFTVTGERWEGELTLVVRIAEDARANQQVYLPLEAHGGGCAGPAGADGHGTMQKFGVRVGYVGDVRADADVPIPNSDGTYVWTVRLQNVANGDSVVHFESVQGDGVTFLDYPAELTLHAPTDGQPSAKSVHVILAAGASPERSGALAYQWRSPVAELGPGGEDVIPVDLTGVPAAEQLSTTRSAGEDVPGFELIPLALALTAAALLHLRRRR